MTACSATTISYNDTTPRTGQLFGYRDLVGTAPQSTVAFNVHYDNFRVVPEPSTLGALAAGLLVCMGRRRNAGVESRQSCTIAGTKLRD